MSCLPVHAFSLLDTGILDISLENEFGWSHGYPTLSPLDTGGLKEK